MYDLFSILHMFWSFTVPVKSTLVHRGGQQHLITP